jgi:hypothetical protein
MSAELNQVKMSQFSTAKEGDQSQECLKNLLKKEAK